MQKITTKTGSYYEIKHGRWRKNGQGGWESVWGMQGIDRLNITSWDDITNPEATLVPVQVGLSLYITSRDSWWLSTPVVSIEEFPDENLTGK